MSERPHFGRKAKDVPPVPARPAVPPQQPPNVAVENDRGARSFSDLIEELRTLALTRMEPAVAAAMSQDGLRRELDSLVGVLANERNIQLNARDQASLAEELVQDMRGLGPLEPLLRDESVTDILVNAPARVYVERAGHLHLTAVRFRDEAQIANIAQRIASRVGRRIDESSPMVDARLADGSRVNIVFPPLAFKGTCISIRKFARTKLDFPAMVKAGSISPAVGRSLEIAARCRLNVIVSGGTGSGKTTLLNAMSLLIDPSERIITIEDTAELQLRQPHVVSLESRLVNIEGRGEVTQRSLVRNALRMRPDRIIVGEVRGPEAFDMLQAMNTGHDGSMSTIHANSPRDAVTRIEDMVLMGAMNLPSRSIRSQIVNAIDLVVQIERQRDGVRRVTQVTEIVGMENEVVQMIDHFTLQSLPEGPDGRLVCEYKTSPTRPRFSKRLEYFGLSEAWMAATAGRAE